MWFDNKKKCKDEKENLINGLDEQWTSKFQ
jgi:hypothetical protein